MQVAVGHDWVAMEYLCGIIQKSAPYKVINYQEFVLAELHSKLAIDTLKHVGVCT